MSRCYTESRKSAARGTESVAADVMRHLYSRQYLGKAVVVCDTPVPMLSAARKQWLKLARTMQKQRASTLNADKILKYTHMITHMQHLHFSAKTPVDNPVADVYFLHPSQLAILPIHCWTVYVLATVDREQAQSILRLLPSEALVVDYTQSPLWIDLGLHPKHELEERLAQEWQRARQFLHGYDVDIAAITDGDIHNMDAMDDALDTLLGMSPRFLQVAQEFQRALELARPLRISREVREHYDSFILLAHRVQALSPGAFTQQFLEIYNEDDTFFLYDARRRLLPPPIGNGLSRFRVAANAHPLIRKSAFLQLNLQQPFLLHPYIPELPLSVTKKRAGEKAPKPIRARESNVAKKILQRRHAWAEVNFDDSVARNPQAALERPKPFQTFELDSEGVAARNTLHAASARGAFTAIGSCVARLAGVS